MTINLADLSDAELGRLVRRSMAAEAVRTLIQNEPSVTAEKAKARAESDGLFNQDRARRKAAPKIPSIVLNGVTLPAIDPTEVDGGEVAPATMIALHEKAFRGTSDAFPDTEEVTWDDILSRRSTVRAEPEDVAPITAEEKRRVEGLMKVLPNLSKAQARARVLALRTTEGA